LTPQVNGPWSTRSGAWDTCWVWRHHVTL